MSIKIGTRSAGARTERLPQYAPKALAERYEKVRPRDRVRIEHELYRRYCAGHPLPEGMKVHGGRVVPEA